MEVTLTSDQQAFARLAIATGRLHREEEAVIEALALWEERERKRIEFLTSMKEAHTSLARREGRPLNEQSMQELSTSVKQRGRARLAAELAASS